MFKFKEECLVRSLDDNTRTCTGRSWCMVTEWVRSMVLVVRSPVCDSHWQQEENKPINKGRYTGELSRQCGAGGVMSTTHLAAGSTEARTEFLFATFNGQKITTAKLIVNLLQVCRCFKYLIPYCCYVFVCVDVRACFFIWVFVVSFVCVYWCVCLKVQGSD